MNQILVTEKIYVTPELKRKKKIYKILFIISLFSIISLCSVYIYAEYYRNKQEGISGDILSFLEKEEDKTTISSDENALVVKITQEVAEEMNDTDSETEYENQSSKLQTASSTYTAPNGKKYETIGIVRIPKINVNYPILAQTTNVDVMKISPYKFWGANPNEVGNLCIIGHNYRRKGVFFSDVPSLAVGDIVEIQDLSQRTIQYEVYDIHTVDPNDRSDTTQYTNGKKEVTIITCTNDATQRVIVKCTEKK